MPGAAANRRTGRRTAPVRSQVPIPGAVERTAVLFSGRKAASSSGIPIFRTACDGPPSAAVIAGTHNVTV